MIFRRKGNKRAKRPLSMRTKLFLSLGAVAVTLLVSSIISIQQYRSMSGHVTELVAEDMHGISDAQRMDDMISQYNLLILAYIGDEDSTIPVMDYKEFQGVCKEVSEHHSQEIADSIITAYHAYMTETMKLEAVDTNSFINTRNWFVKEVQPKYEKVDLEIDNLKESLYQSLKHNSENFQSGYSRSIIPGVVAVGVGLLLIFMLMFFMMAYYVNPIYRMLRGLEEYKTMNRKYIYEFDGDDQLVELNKGVSSIIAENQQLSNRIKQLRQK